ncbi:MAG: helix-turn-helix transcriptional regulator [Clostridia bacterium]|nr:helix-turn-helix transcriptional regulator [Clostridia bacterium]
MEKLKVIELMNYHHAATWANDFYYYEPSCSFYRLYYYYEGASGFVKNSEKKVKFKNRHLYLLPAYDSHELSKEPHENFGMRFMYVHISVNRFLASDILELNIKQDSAEFFILEAIMKRMESKAETVAIIDLLNSLFDALNIDSMLYTGSGSSFYKVIKYINENLSGDLTNDKLAEIACFQPRYFIRVFKKQFGTTPHKYIQNVRIKHAVNMLQNGKKIAEISQRLGFSEEKSFLRFFKQYKGVSPKIFLDK